LNRRSNRLARYLKELGVGPETRVGICLNRGLNMIEAVLGVLKAGAAYVPLDSSYPLERLAFMLEDAQVLVLISEQSLIDRLPAYWGQLIRIDADWEEISSHSDENPASGAQPGNSAYLIYTSGSTGWPKGVLASHRSLANCIGSQLETYGLTPEDRLLQLLSLSFDAATEEVFLALLSGAGLALHRDPTRIPPGELLDECERLGVTVLHSVPTYFDLLADSSLTSGTRALPGLRLLIAGGESLSADQIEKWRRLAPASRVINAYGPTEATITSTIDETAAGVSTIAGPQVPIGRPIRHAQVYLLDDQGHPVPIGVPGELFISGLGLTRGYLNHADHTAEKFVPNPFKGEVGERMYQTGDRGRYRLDGRIEFIGRKDHQVKVRGHRIELGEIEFMLGQCSGVRTAVVMLSKEERLIAFVVPDRPPEEGSPTELSVKNLRSDLEERLPHYMVPAGFTIVDALPLTPNGKIDRQRLPELEQGIGSPERQEAGPRTPEEEVLAGIFQEVLKLDRVGIHDNFFELGGDSILSIQIIARANEAGLRLAPKQLFQSQSIAELAAVAGLGETIEPEPEPVTGAVPLTPIQEWFFEGNTLEPDHYNQAVMLEAGEPLDLPALRAVIEQLADHHEVLRHRFRKTENGWQQLCEDSDGAATLETIDILAEDELQERRAIEERAAAIQRSFDLSTGPLLKVAVFNAAGGARQLVLIVAHHLVIDGVSWRILLGDLERGYQQARRGEAIKPGVKTSSYKRWAERLKEEAQREESRSQADYWLAETGGRPGRLPVDQEGINTVASGRNLVVSLTEDETRRLLQEIPRAYKTQINEVLLAAVGRAIGEWSGSSTVLVEVEGHGRDEIFEDLDLTRTLGWFTTSHPLRIEIAGGSGVE
ncbi:MAG TPA: amino acid adenylation domain-containing protein, partial [Blastocatellia bacterium]|nr:amino acid adenylation domain-containing protein [Blastocatellia bacterium]